LSARPPWVNNNNSKLYHANFRFGSIVLKNSDSTNFRRFRGNVS
jgi:hypothetical protein